MYTEIQGALDAGDYIGAQDKANAVKAKVAAIADQINAAIAKVKR